jgi:putative flippase GtrA
MRVFHQQLLRFGLVGLISNLALYLLYLGLTKAGMGHKLAMSMLYIFGILQSYSLNKKWTFRYRGLMTASFLRYISMYLTGYLINLIALIVFDNKLGYPHQLVQGMMILFIATLMFISQKYWVFRVSHQS